MYLDPEPQRRIRGPLGSLARTMVPLAPLCLCIAAVLAVDGWLRPSAPLEELALAAPVPTLDYAPNGRYVLIVEREALPPLASLARPMERLAGLRIDPVTRARFTTERPTRLAVRPLAPELEARGDIELALPEEARITGWTWSLDGRRLALVAESPRGAALLVAEPEARGGTLTVATERLHPLFVTPRFTAEGDALVVGLVPDGAPPAPSAAATGPVVLETRGARTPLRTYQDLLRSDADAERFAALARAELALVPVDGGPPVQFAGLGADVWTRAELAPDGRRLVTQRLARPFSLRHPWTDFAETVEVHDWSDPSGPKRRVVAELPLAGEVPIGGVRTGPRNIRWLPGMPSSLVWFEALDGGDPRQSAAHRDRVLRLDLDRDLAGDPRPLCDVVQRATGLMFTDDPERFVVREYDRDRRSVRAVLVDSSGRSSTVVLEERSESDAYGDPGTLATCLDARGFAVLRRDAVWVFRLGAGASPDGERPFLAAQRLDTGERRELWRATGDGYERAVALFDGPEGGTVTVALRREAANLPPRDTLVALALPDADRTVVAPRPVYTAADPQPALRAVQKERLRYTRADGVPLSGVLHLPPGYDGAAPLPLLIWAYPREFTDVSVAGQVRGSTERFTTVTGASHLALVLAGYAVLDDAAMPIVGDPETVNDTFLAQLAANAEAAIAACVARGVADPARVAVGGHSYGAFMTANLLAHTDLFRAGIARSGAYNRTLTPFGFQAERRPLWEARETYLALSPFLHAEGIREPLLLLHGALDSNSGTFPEQSERLFAALQGLGGTARLALLPHEDHGYRSREAVLHAIAEMEAWLGKHLAN